MTKVNVSRDALTKVKSALNEYRTDISGFAVRVQQLSADTLASADMEMKKHTNLIEDTTNKVLLLQAQISQLVETINQMANDEKTTKQYIKTAQRQLAIKQEDLDSLKRAIATLWQAECHGPTPNRAVDSPSVLSTAIFSGASEVANPSNFAQTVVLAMSIIQMIRGRNDIPEVLIQGTIGTTNVILQRVIEELQRVHQIENPLIQIENKQHIICQLESVVLQVKSDIEQLKEKITELEQNIEKLRQKIKNANEEKSKKEDELHTTKKFLN